MQKTYVRVCVRDIVGRMSSPFYSKMPLRATCDQHFPLCWKISVTQPRTTWGTAFHFSFIPGCPNAFITLASLFPFLFALLLGPQVKWRLRALSVLLGAWTLRLSPSRESPWNSPAALGSSAHSACALRRWTGVHAKLSFGELPPPSPLSWKATSF